jgi:catechol 2,3-dioxygenase-like lactoylglutathione lyase family enzyme
MSPPVSRIELVGFDHVDLRVRNRVKLRRFFVEQLGMDLLGEGLEHSFLLFGDQVLGLHDPPKGARPTTVDHIAFRVSDWTGLRNRVRRARITVLSEKERSDSRSLFLRGPDGLSIELVWRPEPGHHDCDHKVPPAPPTSAEGDDDDSESRTPPRRRVR